MNLNTLKQEVSKAKNSEDIASLYIVEKKAEELFDEDMLHDFYSTILDLALEKLTDALESHRYMDISEVQDYATLRALYEYAMQHYSSGSIDDAAALFEVLGGLTIDEDFSHSLKLHTTATQANISFDDFLFNIADMDKMQKSNKFYINAFKKEAQNLLDKSQRRESK